MNIFDYWWIWDYLALEWVEDWGSFLVGFIAFSVVFTLTSPVSLLALHRRWWFVGTVLVWLWLSVWMLTTYQVHEIWNAYQHWYITPLGAPIG